MPVVSYRILALAAGLLLSAPGACAQFEAGKSASFRLPPPTAIELKRLQVLLDGAIKSSPDVKTAASRLSEPPATSSVAVETLLAPATTAAAVDPKAKTSPGRAADLVLARGIMQSKATELYQAYMTYTRALTVVSATRDDADKIIAALGDPTTAPKDREELEKYMLPAAQRDALVAVQSAQTCHKRLFDLTGSEAVTELDKELTQGDHLDVADLLKEPIVAK